MKKKFLLYIIHVSILDIRERSYQNKDNITFGLCNLIHNIPSSLFSEDDESKAFSDFVEKIQNLDMQEWLEKREEEFYDWFPEYRNKN